MLDPFGVDDEPAPVLDEPDEPPLDDGAVAVDAANGLHHLDLLDDDLGAERPDPQAHQIVGLVGVDEPEP